VFEFKRPELKVVLDNELRQAALAIALQRLEEQIMEESFLTSSSDHVHKEEEGDCSGDLDSRSHRPAGLLRSFFNTSPSSAVEPPTKKKNEETSFIRLYNIDTPTKS
jgi:hypothetical protein